MWQGPPNTNKVKQYEIVLSFKVSLFIQSWKRRDCQWRFYPYDSNFLPKLHDAPLMQPYVFTALDFLDPKIIRVHNDHDELESLKYLLPGREKNLKREHGTMTTSSHYSRGSSVAMLCGEVLVGIHFSGWKKKNGDTEANLQAQRNSGAHT